MSTLANKAVQIVDSTLNNTLDTVDNAQNAAFTVTNAAITTGKNVLVTTGTVVDNAGEVIQTAANTTGVVVDKVGKITQTAADTTEKAAKNVGAVVNTAVETGSNVTIDGLKKVGDLTNKSIDVTTESLKAVLGTYEIFLNRYKTFIVKANNNRAVINETNKIKSSTQIYEYLETNFIHDFNKKLNIYKRNIVQVVKNQTKLIRHLIKIYMIKNCVHGYVYGYNCNKSTIENKNITYANQIHIFNDELKELIQKSKTYPNRLESLSVRLKNDILSIDYTDMAPDIYYKKMKIVLQTHINTASNFFTTLLNDFTSLVKKIEEEEKIENDDELTNDNNSPVDNNNNNNDNSIVENNNSHVDNDDNVENDNDDEEETPRGGRKNRTRKRKLHYRTTKRYNIKYSKKSPSRNKSRKRK